MLRGFTYVIIGWLLIAVGGGLADVLSLTIVLPATSAVVLAHAAFAGQRELVGPLAVAVSLGYIEDLHQGAPVGVLSMAFALSYLVLYRAAARVAVQGWAMRTLMSLLAVVLVDSFTLATLLLLADPLAVRPDAIWPMMYGLRWHIIATALVAPPVWSLLQWLFVMFRLEAGPTSELQIRPRSSRR